MRLRVIDIETTGGAPPAEIIEFGRVDVVSDGEAWRVERPSAQLYRATAGIPPEAMAVHHITEAEIGAASPVCSLEELRLAVWSGAPPDALVAHNAAFERLFVTAEATDSLPWICTYKAALRIWPEAPRHSNQVLRYWRGLPLDPLLAQPAHRAAPDAYVTAHILVDLLATASADELVRWTAAPKAVPRIPFGKHRGLQWSEAPRDYLEWMVGQARMDGGARTCALQELERRRALAAGLPAEVEARRRPFLT